MPGDARQDLMPIPFGAAAAKVAVAIFDARRDMVGDSPFDAAANRPTVEIVLAAARTFEIEDLHPGADILITAARIDERLVGHEVTGADAQVETIFGIDRGRCVLLRPRQVVVEPEIDRSFGRKHDLGGWLAIIAEEDAGGRRIAAVVARGGRPEEHTSEHQSLMRISYAVLCLKTHRTYIPTRN